MNQLATGNWKIIFPKLLTAGHEVIPNDLQAYHRLEKKETVIVKFKSRKKK